jgi:predicted RNA-binding Zn ribbon-like protein
MSWTATERFGAHTAPDGLALVQELVNTHAVASDGADLLADQAAAGRWLRQAASQWARISGLDPPELTLSADDLRALRELRAVVRDMLAVPPAERPADLDPGTGTVTERAQARLVTDRQGRVALLPLGTGADWLASAIWSEVLLAQRSGAWSRVKLCREPGCRTAFYDASRNGSGAWHNVRTCGNITNLRASRARRKAQAEPHPGPRAAPGSQL